LNISLFAQISWTELEPHNAERTQIETVTSEGDIIGTLNYPPMLIISNNPNYSQNDNHYLGIATFSGLTWQAIIDPDLQEFNYQRIFSHSPRWGFSWVGL